MLVDQAECRDSHDGKGAAPLRLQPPAAQRPSGGGRGRGVVQGALGGAPLALAAGGGGQDVLQLGERGLIAEEVAEVIE